MAKKAKQRFSSTDTYISMALGLAVVLLIGAAFYNFLSKRNVQQTENGKTATESAQVALPLIHTVEENDSLWTIAEGYYNNGYDWVEIQKANNLTNPDMLAVGQTLVIPEVKEKGEVDTLAASVNTKPMHDTVIVVPGDTLWGIAQREYGNGYRWTDIAKANNLVNPDLIHRGNVLHLP